MDIFNLLAEIIGKTITFDKNFQSRNQKMFFLIFIRQTRREV